MINRTLARAGMASAAVAILAAGYFGFIWARDTFFAADEVVEVNDPEGYLLVSMGLGLSTSTEEGMDIRSSFISIEDGEILLPPLELVGSEDTTAFHYSNSPADNWSVFLAKDFSIDPDSVLVGDFTVYRADMTSAETWDDMVAAWEGAEAVSTPDSEDFFRDVPVVDDRGRVLYSSLSEENLFLVETPDELAVEAWNIYLINESGEKTYVTNGTKPHFLGEDRIVFLRTDGIYTRDIASSEEETIFSHSLGISFISGLDVSLDQQHIVFTDPINRDVLLFDVQQDGSIELTKDIQLAASFAVFSPENNHLALVLLEPYARIGYYSLVEEKLLDMEMDLSSEVIEAAYLNGWR